MEKKKGTKTKPKFKQMAFETAVRNPERYIDILTVIKDFEDKVLDDDILLDLVSTLYLKIIVSSNKISITETTNIDAIKDDVISVNSSRNSDGGFPKGYASRFWTYMRTLSELGFVYARYNEQLKISSIAKLLIERKIDEQQAFSIQAIKYNRKNPYRNVCNDFNFFKFLLKVLLELKKRKRALSYEQFIVAMFSKTGNVSDFLKLINKNQFVNFNDTYSFVQKYYNAKTTLKTITGDYPDVVCRVFIISGFVSIRYSGKKHIELNENKLNYIHKLLELDWSLQDEEKIDAKRYFAKLNTRDDELLRLVKEFEKDDIIDGKEYVNKIFDIIKIYNINEKIIIDSINKITTRESSIEEFKEIPAPLKLEFFISILIALKYGKEFAIRPNYKTDHIGKPYSHAPGNTGDIEIFSQDIYWLIEVTLIRNRIQQLNHETTTIIRHLYSNKEFEDRLIKYLSFIAPVIHEDTKNYLDYSSIMGKDDKNQLHLKPYTIAEFIDITIKKKSCRYGKIY